MNGYLIKQVLTYSRYKGAKRMVLVAIVGYMGDDRLCFPSIKKIAAYASMSPRSVKKHLAEMCWSDELTDELRAQGVSEDEILTRSAPFEPIIRHRLSPRGDHTSNWYYLRPYANENEPDEMTGANGNGKRRARRTS